MKQYTGEEEIYVPDKKGEFEACRILTGYPELGNLKALRDVIVLTEEELLDLMQEVIEHSVPTLLRTKAQSFLESKLKYNGH